MRWLQTYLKNHERVAAFAGQSEVFAHVSPTQEALLILGSVALQKKPLFIVKENEQKARNLIELLLKLDETLRIAFYNQEESLRVEAITQSDVMRAERIVSLHKILSNEYDVCITHAVAAVRKISSPDVLKEKTLSVSVNDTLDPQTLIRILLDFGYERVKYVERPFTFSVRGGILDVFSVQETDPLRIEFFDTEIDSLRYFDIESQRSTREISEATILFAKEVILTAQQRSEIIAGIDQQLQKETQPGLIHEMAIHKENIAQGHCDSSAYPLLGYAHGLTTICDYVQGAISYLSPQEPVKRTLQQFTEDTFAYYQERKQMDEMILVPNILEHLWDTLDKDPIKYIYEYEGAVSSYLPWHQAEMVAENLRDTLKILEKQCEKQRIILALHEENMEKIIDAMVEEKIPYTLYNETIQAETGIFLDYSEITAGFVLEDINTYVYTSKELLKYDQKHFRYDNKFSKAEVLNQLQDLNLGDFVVHRQYGIGKYHGIMTKEVEGIHKDFMKIMYRDGDELFVPIEQVSLIRKYLSSEAVAVRLSKLGSSAWQKSKERIQADVKEVADRLVKLYSQRMESKGFAFSPDTEYQIEFEKQFPYELTHDQKIAIAEIKQDMEQPLPMDRLLCGDVGFGKTEVAIRAAFKAFVDHKQVVFLCPTTILSAQHTRTIKERFKDYPITVEVLNRFITDKQQKDIIRRVKAGQVDILIGTHRVLSKDVKFKELGLLIIDEEQRFGVEHKEKIKEMKVSLDVLSLSATPIPRTLQMSLVGLRSLSQLNTPPSNRLPVMTYVIEKNPETVYDIIRKELARDGQVFYLYNNIEQIYSVASQIQMKIDDVKVAVVHGQMDRTEIEDVMFQFIHKEVNVLVCTTIIETGIDIPNANTILVENAHRFGLSQLYQIKGRVGRSDRLAYAYFLVPSKKSLTEIAAKRLQAIKEFTQLGSGYKIAMRDLTIRGAGELLGGNQSGFIDTVGIDLYIDLLKEAIAMRQGQSVPEPETDSKYHLPINGYLPEHFTSDDGEKLDLYQQINGITTIAELRVFQTMIKDRYGALPHAVEMLMEKKRLEILLDDERIDSFKERTSRIDLSFTEDFSSRVDGIHLFEMVSDRSKEIKIKYVKQKITITMKTYPEWVEDLLYILENIKEKDHATR